jgi:phosphohistidine swiveling domain-containing protein
MTATASTPPEERSVPDGVLTLDHPWATDVDVTGGKAAALAEASASGLRTLPGVVLTTAFCRDVDGGAPIEGHAGVARAFEQAKGWPKGMVARSSSVVEDMGDSSQAGQFESVIGIEGIDELSDAVGVVLASRERADATDHPIAVLIQPFVEPRFGGVLFGVDPVTGRPDRRVVTAVEGQPDPLVSGEVEGSRYVLEPDGSVVRFHAGDGPELPSELIEQLVGLSDRAAAVFGEPQDVEWAVVDGELVLLQSRPVTTEIRGIPQGPLYGPGPVAETFPDPLSPLEADLWVPPLDAGVREALRLGGAIPDSRLDGADLVVVVDGYAAIDLERTGEMEGEPPGGGLGVMRRIRRLRSAWRIGRLRSALPALGERVVRQVDEDLDGLPRLDAITDRQLVALLGRSTEALRSLHAHEVLMGLLTDTSQIRLTGASVAMRVLTEARTDGRTDAEILARSPVVLALTGPKIGAEPQLPDESTTPELAPSTHTRRDGESEGERDAGIVREALRLRVRWVQELEARAAWELGERLTRTGRLPAPELVRLLSLEDLAAVVSRHGEVVTDVVCHRAEHGHDASPLPARFRISDRGRPVPELSGGRTAGGTGAGGGRGTGVVIHDLDDPPDGAVLVVTSLSPAIGPMLGRLNGVVAETGSVLAHLAILAREAGVPTVVGYQGAVDELDEGQQVTVDGSTGEVTPAGDSDGADGEDPS